MLKNKHTALSRADSLSEVEVVHVLKLMLTKLSKEGEVVFLL